MKPRGIVLHTAAVRGDTTAAAIDKYHREHNGWKMCGYHRVVRKDGEVQVGRPLYMAGAHLAGANDTLGVCVTGHGDYEFWTEAQTQAVVALCVEWCRHYGWDASHVIGHREGPAKFGATPTGKTCPGKLIDLDAIRALVTAGLGLPPSKRV